VPVTRKTSPARACSGAAARLWPPLQFTCFSGAAIAVPSGTTAASTAHNQYGAFCQSSLPPRKSSPEKIDQNDPASHRVAPRNSQDPRLLPAHLEAVPERIAPCGTGPIGRCIRVCGNQRAGKRAHNGCGCCFGEDCSVDQERGAGVQTFDQIGVLGEVDVVGVSKTEPDVIGWIDIPLKWFPRPFLMMNSAPLRFTTRLGPSCDTVALYRRPRNSTGRPLLRPSHVPIWTVKL
jgi:hypothetical protein